MNTGLLNVFHDRPNDRILPIGDAVDVHLGGVFEKSIKEDGSARGDFGALLHVGANFLYGVNDTHGPTAQDKGGAE